MLDKKALAAPAAEARFVGPGAVPITLKINGKPQLSTWSRASRCWMPCATIWN